MPTTVALLGGGSGRKTALAAALHQALALRAPGAAVVIDPTASLSQAGHHDLTLLLAPDSSDHPDAEATHARLRSALLQAGVAFQVLHGEAAARVQQALRAIGNRIGRQLVVDDPALTQGRGRWTCDNCSDPECEHRLFTALLARP